MKWINYPGIILRGERYLGWKLENTGEKWRPWTRLWLPHAWIVRQTVYKRQLYLSQNQLLFHAILHKISKSCSPDLERWILQKTLNHERPRRAQAIWNKITMTEAFAIPDCLHMILHKQAKKPECMWHLKTTLGRGIEEWSQR